MHDFDFKQQPGLLAYKKRINKGQPLVSIITPFYNSGKYFRQTANSVFNQTFPYFEWIIVNDGSTNTEDIEMLLRLSEEDSRIKILNKENGGISSARNLAIKNASTEIIVVLDADDLIAPTYIECIYWSLYCNPVASWSYTDVVGFFNQEYLWNKSFSSKTMKKENILTCTAGIRKCDLFEVGLYNESEKHYNEDWKLWLELLSRGKYPVHMSWYGFWYRRTDNGVLSIVKEDPQIKAKSKKMIEEVAQKVNDKIEAIEYPRYKSINFEKPSKWDWQREPIIGKEKINILMLLPHMEMGGADIFNLDIVSRLNKNEFVLSIITTNPAESVWRQRFEEHVTDIFDLTSFLDVKDWSAFIHYFIKSRNIDIIFVSNSYYGYYLVPWIRKEYPEVAIIDYVHMEEWYWRSGGYARTSAVVGDILEKTYVCNEHLRQVMIKEFNKKSDSVETLYIGVDEKEFDREKVEGGIARKALGISESRPVILFPCRLHPQKRPYLMVEIAKEVRKHISDICFIVVGDGPQESELREKVEKEGLKDTIYFAGRQKDVKPYYRDSDITLICSLKEGLALTAYESLSMGVPVITSDVGGQKELVDNEVGRILPLMQTELKDLDNRVFKREEIDQYVNAIIEIISDRVKYEEMSKRCRSKIESNFTKDKMIERLEKEFKEIKQGRGLERRKAVSAAVNQLPNLIDDYMTIFCEFLKKDIEAEEVWKARTYFKELIDSKDKTIEELKSNPVYMNCAVDELQRIYSMRTWKMVQKYVKFMNENKIGRFLNSVKNFFMSKF